MLSSAADDALSLKENCCRKNVGYEMIIFRLVE